ncbi:MAG TPA: HigA family addiction module antitoxin [Ktedonosporobacter sp.]|jgi:addiction module HigA family antidote|nr:HigA family addiction module antitoxin [Ktedonosporobacter sp.]
MASRLQNEYQPDLVSSPGETLLETLETISMSQAELARRMGRPVKTINEIVQGKAAITAETALQLEQVLHIPASFWLRREQQYRESLARLAEKQHLAGWVEWLKEIPVREIMRRGWMPSCSDKSQQVLEALKFFSVASPEAWRAIWEDKVVVYRKSAALASNFGAVTAWLRQGEKEAQAIETAPYNAEAFQEALKHICTLTEEPVSVFQQKLMQLCADAGVAVVFVQELPKTGICGATQWLTPKKALIQLSLRYKTDDQLWFTFFHEAGHILRHGKRQIFLEIEQKDRKEAEDEADKFATDILIEPARWKSFVEGSSCRSKTGIKQFAQTVGIAPGIVVGRLQHEQRLPFNYCNDLKRRLEWKTDK